ncbi:MAG: protein translocase subunit SecD [Eubacteriales bacterium]|nr:protein translocase subunit SecD [Eubacteriales bacterium]
MKAKSLVKLGIVTVLIIAIAIIALTGFQIGKYKFLPVGKAISLGLDLSGGVSTVYRVTDTNVDNYDALLEGTISALRTRLTNQGYTEATVSAQGDDCIRVEIPDVDDPQAVMDIIGTPAHLEFRDPTGAVIIEGDDIKNCGVSTTENSMYCVAFELTSEGAKAFGDATTQWVGNTISIYLDNEEISSPRVNQAITGGSGSITFTGMTQEESYEASKRLVTLILSGALPLDIEESETRAISATLGIEAIDGALLAGILGLALVALFMIIMYRLPGFASSLALCIYVLIVLYALAIFGAQLTLQGIAGILLGIGMAVDANVIIFERFREELKNGRSVMNAVTFGFKNAFSAVLDASVTTVIAAVVLLYFGTGSVQGFATTLLISVVASFFTAVFVTRWLLKLMVRLGIKNMAAYTR